jgi:hypothetical protein
MDDGKRSKEYNQGYEDAEKDLLDKENVKLFTEGYKAGYRDGYQAAMKEMKKVMTDQMPPEIKRQMEEGGQGVWWPW